MSNLESRVRSLENFRWRIKNAFSRLAKSTDLDRVLAKDLISDISEHSYNSDSGEEDMEEKTDVVVTETLSPIPEPREPDPPQESIREALSDVFRLISDFILEQSNKINFGFPKDTRDVRNTLFKRARARTVPTNPTIEEVNNQLSDAIFYMTSYRHTATSKDSVKNVNELKRQHKILGELITVAGTLNKEVQKLI